MKTIYRIKKASAYLDYFTPNGLPMRTKNGVSLKDIIGFSKSSYITFDDPNEAHSYIDYMKKCVSEELPRYDTIHWYCEEALFNILNRLHVESCTTLN